MKAIDIIGEDAFVFINIVAYLLVGWPLYLIINVSGGKSDYNLSARDKNMHIDHFHT